MNNQSALTLVEQCEFELGKIDLIIQVLGNTNNAVPYLTKYAIVKVCGTLEQCFKIIISDFSCSGQSNQVKKFVDISFRESSINPNLENIHSSLKKFDEQWNDNFKSHLNTDPDVSRIKASIKSLNNARNEFAHGGNPMLTFSDISAYFIDARKIIEYIDQSLI